MGQFLFENVSIVAWIFIALINLMTAAVTWHTSRKVAVVEKSTNGMKDALVKATREAAFIAGTNHALTEAESKANALLADAAAQAVIILETARQVAAAATAITPVVKS
jgi:F0F1-type ATP synthase membrane subunit b/b'